MDQEIGVAASAGVLCPDGIKLSRNEDSLFTWETCCDGHSDVDVEGLATDSSGF